MPLALALLCRRCKHRPATTECPCTCAWPLCEACRRSLERRGYGKMRFHGPGSAA